jgi:hypothetical protein
MNSVHNFPPYNIHSNIISHLHPGLSTGLFPIGFQTKIVCAFLISSMRATSPAYVESLKFQTMSMVEEMYWRFDS